MTLALTMKLDTFEKVKKAIDEMKADLKKQPAAEVEKKAVDSIFRGFCGRTGAWRRSRRPNWRLRSHVLALT